MTKCAVNVGQKNEWNTNEPSRDMLEGKPWLDVCHQIQTFLDTAPRTITGTRGKYYSSETVLAF